MLVEKHHKSVLITPLGSQLMTRQIVAPLTDDSRGVIYNCNVFMVQATALRVGCQIDQ
jgi:hypothetical protein